MTETGVLSFKDLIVLRFPNVPKDGEHDIIPDLIRERVSGSHRPQIFVLAGSNGDRELVPNRHLLGAGCEDVFVGFQNHRALLAICLFAWLDVFYIRGCMGVQAVMDKEPSEELDFDREFGVLDSSGVRFLVVQAVN